MRRVFHEKIWIAVEPLPSVAVHSPIRLCNHDSNGQKEFSDLSRKRQKQLLREAANIAAATARLPFPTFVVEALTVLEEQRRHAPQVRDTLEHEFGPGEDFVKSHAVKLTCDQASALKDSACLSQWQVRAWCFMCVKCVCMSCTVCAVLVCMVCTGSGVPEFGDILEFARSCC
jgi:hypothetical protein